MERDISTKIKVRKIFFVIFLILSVIFLVLAIIIGIANKDDIINTMAIILGLITGILTIIWIVLLVNFRKLAKETSS